MVVPNHHMEGSVNIQIQSHIYISIIMLNL
jgi:hypothetical protein